LPFEPDRCLVRSEYCHQNHVVPVLDEHCRDQAGPSCPAKDAGYVNYWHGCIRAKPRGHPVNINVK
jgi:hypothetical protein